MRPLPELTPENTPFWTGGKDGRLLITHCKACDHAIHPPERLCPLCLCRDVQPKAARGTGTIYSWTINRQPWSPDMAVPFALAVVDLDGEPGVRLTAKLVDYPLDDIHIGAPVEVAFEEDRDIWFPIFKPATDAALTP